MDLTKRQREVLEAYAQVGPGEVPKSIRKWLDAAPDHQKWGCRLSGVSRVVRFLVAEGYLNLDYKLPAIRGVKGITPKGKRTLKQ